MGLLAGEGVGREFRGGGRVVVWPALTKMKTSARNKQTRGEAREQQKEGEQEKMGCVWGGDDEAERGERSDQVHLNRRFGGPVQGSRRFGGRG